MPHVKLMCAGMLQLSAALERVRAGADIMPQRQLEKVMSAELGDNWRSKLASFDQEPLAAASIGQVIVISPSMLDCLLPAHALMAETRPHGGAVICYVPHVGVSVLGLSSANGGLLAAALGVCTGTEHCFTACSQLGASSCLHHLPRPRYSCNLLGRICLQDVHDRPSRSLAQISTSLKGAAFLQLLRPVTAPCRCTGRHCTTADVLQ